VLGKHEFCLESCNLLKNLRVVGVASDKDCPFFALESGEDHPGLGSHGYRRVMKKSCNEHAARYSTFSYDLMSRSCSTMHVMADCGRQAERSFLTERMTKHKSSWSSI
jgi:hypothetical protein